MAEVVVERGRGARVARVALETLLEQAAPALRPEQTPGQAAAEGEVETPTVEPEGTAERGTSSFRGEIKFDNAPGLSHA